MATKLPFGVTDADGHIFEPEEKLIEYLEPSFREKIKLHAWIPNEEGHVGGVMGFTVSGLSGMGGMSVSLGGRLGTYGKPGFPSPQDWLDNADAGGMETVVVYPTDLLTPTKFPDPDYYVLVARAYNSYIAEEWLKFSPRLKAVALMPMVDIDESISEMRRCVTELGFSGLLIPAVGTGLLGDKQYHRFYEEAEKLDTLVGVHGGHATAESLRYTKLIQQHTIGFPVSNIIQMVHMTYEGVFELFPKLRVAYLEGGCSWVPGMMDRMDDEWGKRGDVEAPNCKKPPSEYIRGGRVFVHAEPGETIIPQVIERMGQNRLFYASDWPHWDHEYPKSIEQIWERKDLTETDKRAILRENALEMYGLTDGG